MQKLSPNENPYANDDKQDPIELHISCTNLDNEDFVFGESDGQVAIYFINKDNQRVLVGETEVMHNEEDPEFKTPIVLDFVFEIHQKVLLICYDFDSKHSREEIGSAEFELSAVMMNQKEGLHLPLLQNGNERGRVNIRPVRPENQRFEYVIDIRAKDVKDIEWLSKTDPFIVFRRPTPDFINEKEAAEIKTWHDVYVTEMVKDNLNPNFKPFTICTSHFNKDQESAWTQFAVFDHSKSGNHTCLGVGYFTVAQVIGLGQKEFKAHSPEGEHVGTFVVEKFEKRRRYTLGDYLYNGLHLSTEIGFDFTDGNGDAADEEYLHKLCDNVYNTYEQAVVQIGSILHHYDTDNLIPTYGYGFSAPGLGISEPSFCYPLNGNFGQPHIKGYLNILPAYRALVPQIVPGGPRNMAPILSEAIKAVQATWQQNKLIYTILIILTAGELKDEDQVMSLVNSARNLPLSILLVGIGDEDMDELKHLDDGHAPDSRDILQFVHYDKHSEDREKLAKELLHEIPGQVISFYRSQGIFPN